MLQDTPSLQVTRAASQADIRAAQRLRYDVFVAEMGATGPYVDHEKRLERDPFDDVADHILLRDMRSDGEVIGVYRVMTREQARKAGSFYSADEFDLTPLIESPRTLLELGRSCLHPKARGGAGLMALWQGLSDYVTEHEIDTLFGVASFPGTDLTTHQNALSHLHHAHLAPPEVRVISRTPHAFTPSTAEEVDRKAAMRDTPALIKSYLKLGGVIGEGVFVDYAFNTIDVCLILETKALTSARVTRPTRRSR